MEENMKLKSTNIGNKTEKVTANPKYEKDRLITRISNLGNQKNDLLLKFMETFKLSSLQEATVKQLEAFIEQEKSSMIWQLHNQSNREGDKLIDFMRTYKLIGLNEATVEQLSEYIAKHPKHSKHLKQTPIEPELGPSL